MPRESPPYGRVPGQQVVHVQRPRRRRRRQPGSQKPRPFKWFLFGVPLAVALALWLAHGTQCAYRWSDCMDALHVHYSDRERYTELATLSVLITASLAAYRVMKK